MKLLFKNGHVAVLESSGGITYTVNLFDIDNPEANEYVGVREQSPTTFEVRISREWYEENIKPVLFPEQRLSQIHLSGTLLSFLFNDDKFQLGFAINSTREEAAFKLQELANMIYLGK